MTESNNHSEITKLLSDSKHRIELHKIVQDETDKAYSTIEALQTQTQEVEQMAKQFIGEAENASKKLQNIFAYGCYFGTPEQAYLWTSSLNQLGAFPQTNGSTLLIDLQIYPALLTIYMGGLASVAAKSGYNLAALVNTFLKKVGRDPVRLITMANCWGLNNSAPALLNIEKNRYTPLSDYLEEHAAKFLPKEVLLGQDIEELFDTWEILIAMVMADDQRTREGDPWVPIGRFGWRSRHDGGPLDLLESEVNDADESWFPLQAGLFGGSSKRAKESLAKVKNLAGQRGYF